MINDERDDDDDDEGEETESEVVNGCRREKAWYDTPSGQKQTEGMVARCLVKYSGAR